MGDGYKEVLITHSLQLKLEVLTHLSKFKKGEKSLTTGFLGTAKLLNHPACWGEQEKYMRAYPNIAEHTYRLYPWKKTPIAQQAWRP